MKVLDKPHDKILLLRKQFTDMKSLKEYINESYEDDYGVALDSKGREIHKGDWVVWTDPDGGRKTKYEVYEEPTEDMVKLSNKYGECEALPEECTLVKK